MQDSVLKSNGKAHKIKAPSDMPTTFDVWRTQLLNGNGYLDVTVNTDTGDDAGLDTVGTALNKANLLTDATATALGLTSDATVNDALNQLSSKTGGIAPVLRIHTLANQKVWISRLTSTGSTSSSRTADANGLLTLALEEQYNALGDLTLTATINNKELSIVYPVNTVGYHDLYIGTTLENTPWSAISAEYATSGATPANWWADGDTKTIEIGGIPYTVRLVDVASGTFLLDSIYYTRNVWNSTATRMYGWQESIIRNEAISRIWGMLNRDLQDAIVQQSVNTYTYNGTSTGLTTTKDKLYLPSEYQLKGASTYGIGTEGTQWSYFKSGGTLLRDYQTNGGSGQAWWLRSGASGNTANCCCVTNLGAVSTDAANVSKGIVFAFNVK